MRKKVRTTSTSRGTTWSALDQIIIFIAGRRKSKARPKREPNHASAPQVVKYRHITH
jgi:hypothetical protein